MLLIVMLIGQKSDIIICCFFSYKEQENVSTNSAEKRLQQAQNVRSVSAECFSPAVARRKYRTLFIVRTGFDSSRRCQSLRCDN